LIERFVRLSYELLSDFWPRTVKIKRPRPLAKRIWASVEKSSSIVLSELFEEALRRDPKQYKEWVVLVDGQGYQLHEIQKIAQLRSLNITIILDLIHVIEYLWEAAHVFFEESNPLCEEWVESKLLEVLKSQGRKVLVCIRMSAAKRNLSDRQLKKVETAANYLSKNQEYNNSQTYLHRGYPIGTFVIEGTCRYLIKDRMDITGDQRGLEGAFALLKLRSIIKSNDERRLLEVSFETRI